MNTKSKRVQTRVKRRALENPCEFPRETKRQIVAVREMREAWVSVLVHFVNRAAAHGWNADDMLAEAKRKSGTRPPLIFAPALEVK